jgi:hypothetical protein
MAMLAFAALSCGAVVAGADRCARAPVRAEPARIVAPLVSIAAVEEPRGELALSPALDRFERVELSIGWSGKRAGLESGVRFPKPRLVVAASSAARPDGRDARRGYRFTCGTVARQQNPPRP